MPMKIPARKIGTEKKTKVRARSVVKKKKKRRTLDKTVRLERKTHKRLMKHKKADEVYNDVIDRLLNVYEGKVKRSTKIKELKDLQDDFVDAINSLRRTYDKEWDWKITFPFNTFALALSFDWNTDVNEVSKENDPPEVLDLRRRWLFEIQKIVEQIKKESKITLQEELFR